MQVANLNKKLKLQNNKASEKTYQIYSDILINLKKISKNTKCLSRKDLDLKTICYVCQEKV